MPHGGVAPRPLAAYAQGRLCTKLPQLRQALEGRVTAHHLILIKRILAHLDFLEESLAELQSEIERALLPSQDAVQLLQTIPGVGATAAAAIVAEIGTDMSRFPSAQHLALWARLCPGNRQSGGTRLSGKPTGGDTWLNGILGEVAWQAQSSGGSRPHCAGDCLSHSQGQAALSRPGSGLLRQTGHRAHPPSPRQSSFRARLRGDADTEGSIGARPRGDFRRKCGRTKSAPALTGSCETRFRACDPLTIGKTRVPQKTITPRTGLWLLLLCYGRQRS